MSNTNKTKLDYHCHWSRQTAVNRS